ncbi:MAG: AI-2E family transporter [Gammaproteobacteria bacterium]|nr:AI-2E family transporter [Gammaproteobacteria bacterium]
MRRRKKTSASSMQVLLIMTCIIVIIAGIKAAAEIVSPFILSVFIAIISAPPLFWMEKHKVPKVLAMLIIIAGIVVFSTAIFSLVGSSVETFTRNIPQYSSQLQSQSSCVISWLGDHGVTVNADLFQEYFNPSSALTLVANTLSGFGVVLTNGFLILLTVIFILFEASSFPNKLRTLSDRPEASLRHYRRITQTVEHYIALKTVMSLGTGTILALWVYILGVDFPLLWGLLAFLLNFVPNIGSFIAAVPPTLLALVQLGPTYSLLTAAGYVIVNTVIGNMIEPRFMGKGLGLSTLVVFLSLVFWGWVLGPVGMLLSVPLTMTIKIILEVRENTRWIAILLGPEILTQTKRIIADKPTPPIPDTPALPNDSEKGSHANPS